MKATGVAAGSGPRVAIVGCGAVSEYAHVPALRRIGVPVSALFDVVEQRARDLAVRCDGAIVLENLDAVSQHAEAAIVAVPHHLHAAISCQLLQAGVHVLVEKPMAPTVSECRDMMAAASHSGAVLEVGLMRRHAHALRWLASLMHSGSLGEIEYIDIREGFVFAWPVTSERFFSSASGGVLLDTGAHTLDLVAWLDPELRVESYADDGRDGAAADSRIVLVASGDRRCVVELSRTRNLRNSVIVVGRSGSLEVDLFGQYIRGSAKLMERLRPSSLPTSSRTRSVDDLFDDQLRSWFASIRENSPPVVGAEQATRSIALIEACVDLRQDLILPWEHRSPSP